MARSSIFTHGYVVGILVLSRGDSDDEGRLPDAVASPNKPTFTRLRDQYKLPLPAPESGAAGAFVSHTKITTAVIQSGPHVGQLTSDVDKAGAPLPTATPGVELVVGAYRVDLGLGYSPQTFEIEVTEEHTQASPLDLYSAAPYVPGQGQPVTTVLLPAGASVGDVLTFGPDGVEWAAPTGGEGGASGPVSWSDVTGKPTTFPPDLTGVSPSSIGAQPAGDYLTAADLPAPPDLSDVVRDGDPRLSDARPPTAHNHDGVYVKPADLPAAPTWGTLSGKPAVIAAGTSQTAARNAIGAGTSSLQLGTGPTTAAAGDHTHSQYATNTALTNGLAGKADTGHNHDGAYRAASWTPSVADLPAGSTLALIWHNNAWRTSQTGTAITSRPTARTDIRVMFHGGTTAPAWAIAGDIHAPGA